MPSKPRDHSHTRSPQSFRRHQDLREIKQRFLIVCEGMETEVKYFEGFKMPGRLVRIEGIGKDPVKVVAAMTKLRANKFAGEEFEQCWCVFDTDGRSPRVLENAVTAAAAKGYRIAYSNEAFELWYLLHFHYHDARLSRDAYGDLLSGLLGRPYDKAGDYFQELMSKQETAIKNAKRLMSSYRDHQKPHGCCPGTTVHLLVEELNKNT